MKTVQLPERYQHVMPYLILENAKGFLSFVKEVFDARETHVTHREDGSIMHGEVMIGDSTIMFAQASDQWGVNTAGMYVNVSDADETYKKGIAAGATSLMEVSDQSYGRSGGFKDKFGNTWWVVTP